MPRQPAISLFASWRFHSLAAGCQSKVLGPPCMIAVRKNPQGKILQEVIVRGASGPWLLLYPSAWRGSALDHKLVRNALYFAACKARSASFPLYAHV